MPDQGGYHSGETDGGTGGKEKERVRDIERRGEVTCDHLNVTCVLWALETAPLLPHD